MKMLNFQKLNGRHLMTFGFRSWKNTLSFLGVWLLIIQFLWVFWIVCR